MIGYRRPAGVRFWNHLVAIVAGRWLLDLSIDQGNQPDKGIELGPVVHAVCDGFLTGREPLVRNEGDVKLEYWAEPPDQRFRDTGAWRREFPGSGSSPSPSLRSAPPSSRS